MAFKIARMEFCSPTHFGETGIGVEKVNASPHSDTLFSALCHAWGILFGQDDLQALLDGYEEKTPFVLTSAFLFKEDTYYLPKPLVPPPGFQDAEKREEHGKDLKKRSYIPLRFFTQWAANRGIDYSELLSKDNDPSDAYRTNLLPRVALDRENSTSNLYHFGAVTFREDCGLYFLIDLKDATLEAKLRSSFEFLGEQGLGGERSSGYGRFKLTWENAKSEWDELFTVSSNAYCTLSLFYPSETEIHTDIIQDSAYTLIERRGWFSSPFNREQYKRKSVTMFGEGSVFPVRLNGRLVDVAPERWKNQEGSHNVCRCGMPFWVPVVGRK